MIPTAERKRQQKERWQRDRERKTEINRDQPIRERVKKEILPLIVAVVAVAVAAIVKMTEERGNLRGNPSLNHKRSQEGMREENMIEIQREVGVEKNLVPEEKNMIEWRLKRRRMRLHQGSGGRQIKDQNILM